MNVASSLPLVSGFWGKEGMENIMIQHTVFGPKVSGFCHVFFDVTGFVLRVGSWGMKQWLELVSGHHSGLGQGSNSKEALFTFIARSEMPSLILGIAG